jgi:hypothetical protein
VNTVIDLADARTRRAIPIAADAGQWARCTARDGRRLFAIPSCKPSLRHLTDATSCTCKDFAYRGGPCKHMTACHIFEAFKQGAAA